eukprot:981207-Pleurochrysis_carterae.AAC.1
MHVSNFRSRPLAQPWTHFPARLPVPLLACLPPCLPASLPPCPSCLLVRPIVRLPLPMRANDLGLFAPRAYQHYATSFASRLCDLLDLFRSTASCLGGGRVRLRARVLPTCAWASGCLATCWSAVEALGRDLVRVGDLRYAQRQN